MTISLTEANNRNKAIKKLMDTLKKNLDLRQKALLLPRQRPQSKIRKTRSFLIP